MQVDLFSQAQYENLEPLAVRMRPASLDAFVGQQHIIGPGKLLRRAIANDQVSSLIFYGPPGTGKTTLAYVISRTTQAEFIKVSATTTGVAELKEIIIKAVERLKYYGQRTILFIDEIQRLHKGQQDILLPALEEGHVILIAATTENPYFEVNGALLSRSRIFQLQPLSEDELQQIARNALEAERGLGSVQAAVEPDALQHLITTCSGDARVLLNALEFAVMTAEPSADGVRRVSLAAAEDAVQAQRVRYDKTGDNHYDTVSAFIKSMRGSDPDAALYWMARMLYANEEPRFIVRRIIVHASEDVGLADPVAMMLAHAAANALEWLGMPEARIPMAQAVLYIATAPKSNSVVQAIDSAMQAVESTSAASVPKHLRDAHYKGAKKLGHGVEYRYPHDYPDHYVPQQYLPEGIPGGYYRPSSQGREAQIRQRLEGWKTEK